MKSNLIQRYFIAIAAICFTASAIKAQIPSTCFEIQSILVDACGSPEGENEMVRFIVGPTPLNVGNLSVNWPNNSFLGICQNATTASLVTTLNGTVQGCGVILEPTAGILPSGAKVLLVTSTNMNPSFNSFASLNDTIYLIFQCAGNTGGHFRNYSSTTALRTLNMSFGAGCSDAVTYDAHLLITQSGTPGAQDGATVDFDFTGNATYENNGCNAPVTPLTFSISSTPSTPVCAGSQVTLSATINSGSFISSFWNSPSGSFQSPTSLTTSYQTDSLTTGNVNIYFGIVTNCSDTLYDTLQLQILPQAQLNVSSSSGVFSICQGSSLQLTATGGANYIWSTGQTGAQITISSAGNYTVTDTTGCGISTATVTVSVITNSPIQIVPAGSTLLCNGDSVKLNSNGGYGNYQWSNGDTTSFITVATAGLYTVTSKSNCDTTTSSIQVTSANVPDVILNSGGITSICVGDSLTITATGASSYSWSTGQTDSNIVIYNTGVYSVTGSNACGTDTASIAITVGSFPATQITPGGLQTICQGTSLTLTGSGALNYIWSTGATTSVTSVSQAGTYVLTGTNACGSKTDTVTVSVLPLPTAVITASGSTTFCSGDSVQLIASGGNSFLWSDNTTGASIYATSSGIYTVTVSNSCGSSTASDSVLVNTSPVATVSSGKAVLCKNDQIVINGNGIGNYNWSNGSNGSTITIDQPGIYILTVSNNCGSSSDSITIINTSLTSEFIATPVTGTAPLNVVFTNTSLNASSSIWLYGDSTSSTLSSPTKTYSKPGTYLVTLTVTDTNYCSATSSKEIIVNEMNYNIPNVFTPNNDGKNDIFNIIGSDITIERAAVFNRWGATVFEWSGTAPGWDGKYNGNDAPSGTYFYLFTIRLSNGKSTNEYGSVNLLR